MKNKKEMSIRLRKRSIANLSTIKAGHLPPGDSHTCSEPEKCPTTVDPRTNPAFGSDQC